MLNLEVRGLRQLSISNLNIPRYVERLRRSWGLSHRFREWGIE